MDSEDLEQAVFERQRAQTWFAAEEADLAVVDRVPGGDDTNWKEIQRGRAYLDDTFLYAFSKR